LLFSKLVRQTEGSPLETCALGRVYIALDWVTVCR